MKVCLLTRYANLSHAGLGRIYLGIKEGLERRGHEVVTVSSSDHSPLGYLKYSFLDIRSRIPKNVDIYHAVTPMECRYLPPKKTVVTIADMIPWLHPNLSGSGLNNNRINRWVGKAAYRSAYLSASKCARIAVISEQGRQEVIKYLKVPESKVRLIRLGINPDLEPGPKKDKTFRVGYIGQLDRRKRVDLLINAFKESHIDGELVLAGDGIDLPSLFALANGDKRIKFLGFIPDNKLKDFYNSLNVFVFPTKIEGYGLPPVEAMACKKPVMLIQDAIVPDEIKSRCANPTIPNLIFRLNNWIEAIRIWNGNETMYPNLDSNYAFAKSHDWNTFAEKTEELYREVLDGK